MTTWRRHFCQRFRFIFLTIFLLIYAPELIINCQFEQDIIRNVMTGFYCSVWSIKVIKWWYLSNTHIIDHYSSFLEKRFFPQKFSDKLKCCRTSNFPKLVVRRTSANFSLIRPLDWKSSTKGSQISVRYYTGFHVVEIRPSCGSVLTLAALKLAFD